MADQKTTPKDEQTQIAEDVLALSNNEKETIFVLHTLAEKLGFKTNPRDRYQFTVFSGITDLQAKLVRVPAPVVIITDEETHAVATERLLGTEHIIITIKNMDIRKAIQIITSLCISI